MRNSIKKNCHLKNTIFFSFILSIILSQAIPNTSSRDIINKNFYQRDKKQVIILKADDVLYSNVSTRYTDYIEKNNLKTSLGIVAKYLNSKDYCEWLKSLSKKINYEIWNHGYTHALTENNTSDFCGIPFDDQLSNLRNSQEIFNSRIGITCSTWGAPGNFHDINTIRALSEDDNIDIWLYGNPKSEKFILHRFGNIEFPTGYPDYNTFVKKYNENNLHQLECLTFQLHPNYWNEKYFEEFKKVIDFLITKDVIFMTPTEYYNSVTETITVNNFDDSGDSSLRAAINRANQKKGEKSTHIILKPGVYKLKGLKDEDNNTGGDLDIFSNVSIEGIDSENTIIDGADNDRIFHILGGKVNLNHLTLRHGKAPSGGAIRIEKGIVAIKNCLITLNKTTDAPKQSLTGGGGIYSRNAQLIITRCKITRNTCYSSSVSYGGGIYIENSPDSELSDIRYSIIEENIANTSTSSSGFGGGIYISGGNSTSPVFIFGNMIKKNIAGQSLSNAGGGIFLTNTINTFIDKNRFIENIASSKNKGQGGAIAAKQQVEIIISNNLIVNNTNPYTSNCVYLEGISTAKKIQLVTCDMFNNTIVLEKGITSSNAIYIGDSVHLNFINNIVTGHDKGINLKSDAIGSSINIDTNLFFNSQDTMTGKNSILSDPLFSSGYKQSSNSPVVDAGKKISSVSRDIDGEFRPQGDGYDLGCYEFRPPDEPRITLNKSNFFFTDSGDYSTPAQALHVSNSGTGTLKWTAIPSDNWIKVDPQTGTNSNNLSISISASELTPGTYTGTISIADPSASNSPQMITVSLTINPQGISSLPFGEFATPLNNTTGLSGAIPITGWALDDVGIEKVEIYYSDKDNPVYAGDAVIIEDARPDVEAAYPNFPFNYKAGWGYMMLTNFLPGNGNGTYSLHAIAIDIEGNRVLLGTKTITCDNEHSILPFGTIDAPIHGAIENGGTMSNWGWVLTPNPNMIPKDGSTIHILVDATYIGHPHYNIFREDIAGLFPNYANSEGPVGYYAIDTSPLSEGLHTIQWTVTDNAGNTNGIGSRFFSVKKIQENIQPFSNSSRKDQKFSGISVISIPLHSLESIPFDLMPIQVKTGLRDTSPFQSISPSLDDTIYISLKQLEPLEIQFSPQIMSISGYLEVGDLIKPLPAGSNLRTDPPVFKWMPGPGFIGKYSFVFFVKMKDLTIYKKRVIIHIQENNHSE